jgi:lipopolysaccharide/colanic/teichoic acid biosynthesis glycosyltransferase
MQIETLPSVPKNDTKSYLRIATISSKTALCFFYVGDDHHSLKFLTDSFKSGIAASDFESAKKVFSGEEGNAVDAIIIDLPYNEKDLKAFYFFLKNRNLDNIPIIYNGHHLKNEPSVEYDIIDDVIDLFNWQFDFYSKISFLKKSKEYVFTATKTKSRVKINPDESIGKRIVDILLASLLIIILSPVFIIISLAIKLESKGPIFYNANRAGRGFRIFKFFKFRTMEMNADKKIDALAHLNQYSGQTEGVRFFKISNDPRITKVGRFLRNTSLDELPQLFNVIKGDMSLVGNRPLPLYEAATLTTNEFVERFMAPAGMTGLWQIKKRGKSEMSTDERIELDISYARKASLLYDFWIMAKTPAAIFQKSDV